VFHEVVLQDPVVNHLVQPQGFVKYYRATSSCSVPAHYVVACRKVMYDSVALQDHVPSHSATCGDATRYCQ